MTSGRERRGVFGGAEEPEDAAPARRRFARRARIGMLSPPSGVQVRSAEELVGTQRAFTAVLTHPTHGVVSFKISSATEAVVLAEATRQSKYRGGRWRIRVYEGTKLIAAREPDGSLWQRPALPAATPEEGPSTGGQGGTAREVRRERGDCVAGVALRHKVSFQRVAAPRALHSPPTRAVHEGSTRWSVACNRHESLEGFRATHTRTCTMANDQGQKRRDDDLRNARNGADPQAPLASQPREGAHPGPGRDREAVRRGEASQQTDNGPPDLEPAKADQAAHSDKPKDDRGGGA